MPTQRLSIENRSRGSVGAAVVALWVRSAVGGTFALACGSVGAAVVALWVRSAVAGTFALACGSVGAAVVALWVRSAVGRSFPAGPRGRDVIIVECHGGPLFPPLP